MAEQFYVLWVNRNGQHLWEGPFVVEGVAYGRLQMITGVHTSNGSGFVLRGTQMSTIRPGEDFRAARPARLPRGNPSYGPWIVAGYDSDCDGCAGGIMEGDDIRSDGQGGWLCPSCGEKTGPGTKAQMPGHVRWER